MAQPAGGLQQRERNERSSNYKLPHVAELVAGEQLEAAASIRKGASGCIAAWASCWPSKAAARFLGWVRSQRAHRAGGAGLGSPLLPPHPMARGRGSPPQAGDTRWGLGSTLSAAIPMWRVGRGAGSPRCVSRGPATCVLPASLWHEWWCRDPRRCHPQASRPSCRPAGRGAGPLRHTAACHSSSQLRYHPCFITGRVNCFCLKQDNGQKSACVEMAFSPGSAPPRQ